jgi:hypothetical protein
MGQLSLAPVFRLALNRPVATGPGFRESSSVRTNRSPVNGRNASISKVYRGIALLQAADLAQPR